MLEKNNILISVAEATALIEQSFPLIISGSEKALSLLPKGQWIGGTIPYFMAQNGGCIDEENVFVTNIADVAKEFKIQEYAVSELEQMMTDRYADGFSYVLMPAFSTMHKEYALKAADLPSIFDVPTMGWITGFNLNDSKNQTPFVVNGQTGMLLANSAVMMHVELPKGKLARLEILNIFSQGDGDSIRFEKDSFSATHCIINGEKKLLTDYIEENNIDVSRPLVADYSGAQINVSIKEIDKKSKIVSFYAPVHEDTDYKFANKVDNYVDAFLRKMPDNQHQIKTSCNCVLNYVHSDLEGKKTGNVTGPITFGEVAYILLNQTMVYLEVV